MQILDPPTIPSRTILKYLLRFVFSVLTMEILLHFIYVVALKDAKAWRGLGPGELAVVGFWNLIVVWLKVSQAGYQSTRENEMRGWEGEGSERRFDSIRRVVLFLQLLIPWRFFRLWALLDGMDPPENMVRCMANNYSCSGFWRSWHRSYNLWVVRFVFVFAFSLHSPSLLPVSSLSNLHFSLSLDANLPSHARL